MATLTYLCPCCNHTSDHALKNISEIGFSLRNPFYTMLTQAVQKNKPASPDLSAIFKELNNATVTSFKHLSREDINTLFPGKPADVTTYRGTMVVTSNWLKEKTRTAWANRVITEANEDFQFSEADFPDDDVVLHRAEYQLTYHCIDGEYIPKQIQRINDGYEDNDRYSSSLRRCSCGRILDRVTGTAEEIIVVMQGSSRAGKSTTMVAIESILNRFRLADGSPILIESNLLNLDEQEAALAWISQAHEAYTHGKKILKTEKETKYEELLFSFALVVNGRKYVLTLVDMAGEIFDSKSNPDEKWYQNYSYIYQHCHAIWTSIPYQTLASTTLTWDFLLRHRAHYHNNREDYQKDLEAWQKVTAGAKNLPSYEEFEKEVCSIAPPNNAAALLKKFEPVHGARFLAVLGETDVALAHADLETYKRRLEEISNVLPKNRPPHAVILTKTDSIADLFFPEDPKARKQMDDLYIYPHEPEKQAQTDNKGVQPSKQEIRDTVMHYYSVGSQKRHCFLHDCDDSLLMFGQKSGTAALNEETMNRICRNIHSFFKETDELRVNSFHALCPGKTCDFALSAYGGIPGKMSAPKPYHVLLPLLWTLAVNGILPVAYVKTTLRPRSARTAAKEGNSILVTERLMVHNATTDPVSMQNLFATSAPYQFHETRT